MYYTNISKLENDKESKVQGFVETIRNKSKIAFIVIKDITGVLQITVKKDTDKFNEVLDKITVQSVISCTGILVQNESVKLNGKELLASEINIESLAATPLPVDADSLLDTKIQNRWLDLRTDKNQLVFKVQTCFTNACRQFLLEKDFMEMHSPKLLAAPSESGADLFEVDFFGGKAYLAQSPQFYKQMALAGGWERVFESGPVFRAEKHHTHKHAVEFTGFDLEFTNVQSVNDVMIMEEEMLAYAIDKVNKTYGEKIKEIFNIDVVVPTLPFPRMDLNEVYAELKTRYNYTVPAEEIGDLPTEGEKLCKQLAHDKFNHEFIFITGYDTKLRAFYHHRENGIAQGYDLIWKGVEITTGAQREHRYDVLKAQAEEKGVAQSVDFYLNFFKYGCPPHGGFGIGLDRITMLFFDLSIKEAQFVFRGPNNLNP